MTTRQLEILLYKHLKKMGTYMCFEVGIPEIRGKHTFIKERVDLLTYNTKGIWKFYELKVSVSDFRSKNKNSFQGNYNYYVMPKDIYEKVKEEIPKGIGVIIADKYCQSVKQAKRQELAVDETMLKEKFIQALSREHDKIMDLKILKEKNDD